MLVSSPWFVSCTWSKVRLIMSWKMSSSVNGVPWRMYDAMNHGKTRAQATRSPVAISNWRSSFHRFVTAIQMPTAAAGIASPSGPFAIVATAARYQAAM